MFSAFVYFEGKAHSKVKTDLNTLRKHRLCYRHLPKHDETYKSLIESFVIKNETFMTWNMLYTLLQNW